MIIAMVLLRYDVLIRALCILGVGLVGFPLSGHSCTTAVISGRATVDGRPILWKNRDFSSAPHNEVALFNDGNFRVVAVVNAGSRSSIWMGVNEVGLCIENSLSKDLADESSNSGPANGGFMKLVLQTCATIKDVEALLEKTNESGRKTTSNFGVIDARGGAGIFEAGPTHFKFFDANDSQVAPRGYIVRSNFATTAHNLPPDPDPAELVEIYSADRFSRACQIIEAAGGKNGIDVTFVLQQMARDMADKSGQPIPGSINARNEPLPAEINTANTISRTTTVAAAVFHGVKQDEDPRLTTMWAVLGDPKFSIAVPCWATMNEIADPLEDPRGGELGEIARSLRDWSLTFDRHGVITAGLPGIWQDIWPLEQSLVAETNQHRNQWLQSVFSDDQLTDLHLRLAARAMVAMEVELQQARDAAIRGDFAVSSTTREAPVRVAIYDHSPGTANGPKNLLSFLTINNGFDARRVSPEDIRQGVLSDIDVLIMPGGSGSSQAEHLKVEGRKAICDFVDQGGGYVGICAGSYLASSHYEWSLGLINARVWDRAHWARGNGQVRMLLSETGQRALANEGKMLDVYYGQGPLLIPGNNPHLPPYEVLASYGTEIATKGAPRTAMLGTHAIIRASFGKGRVICFSPHPETKTGPNHIMSSSVLWAADKK